MVLKGCTKPSNYFVSWYAWGITSKGGDKVLVKRGGRGSNLQGGQEQRQDGPVGSGPGPWCGLWGRLWDMALVVRVLEAVG